MSTSSDSQPLISIIIPTFNRANTIRRAIGSVLNQTYKKFELIVVDDGSLDDTQQIVLGYSDRRIRFIKHEENFGQNAALNTGLSRTKGDYVAFLDSDDEWLHEMLEKQLSRFNMDPNLGCVYTLAGSIDKSNNVSVVKEFQLEGNIYKDALEQGFVSHMITLMVKRDCFKKIGYFDRDFINFQDDDICLRLAKEYRFGLVPEILAIIHQDSTNRLIKDSHSYAEGWQMLIEKFKTDIIELCGVTTFADHCLKAGKLFMHAGDAQRAKMFFSLSYHYYSSLRPKLYQLISCSPYSVWKFLMKMKALVAMLWLR